MVAIFCHLCLVIDHMVDLSAVDWQASWLSVYASFHVTQRRATVKGYVSLPMALLADVTFSFEPIVGSCMLLIVRGFHDSGKWCGSRNLN